MRLMIGLTTQKYILRWPRCMAVAESWMQQYGDVAGDACTLLYDNIRDGEISAYVVKDEAAVRRVAGALALGRQKVGNTGCIVFDDSIALALGVSIRPMPGGTADDAINRWHYNIVEVTSQRLAALAARFVCMGEGVDYQTAMEPEVDAAIRAAVQEGTVNLASIKLTVTERKRIGIG